MAPFKGVDTWLQAVSGYWPRLVFWESYQKESKPGRVGRGLLYTEDEVMKSLDMVRSILLSLILSSVRVYRREFSRFFVVTLLICVYICMLRRHPRHCTTKTMSSTRFS